MRLGPLFKPIVCTYLLAEAENLEALEVGQVLAALRAVGALSEGALGPLAINLVLSPELLHGTGTGSTGELGNGEVSEGGVGERKNVTGNSLLLLGGGTVDQDLILMSVKCSRHNLRNPNAQFLVSLGISESGDLNVHGGGPQSQRWRQACPRKDRCGSAQGGQPQPASRKRP